MTTKILLPILAFLAAAQAVIRIPPNEERRVCSSLVDAVVVADGSGSIESHEFEDQKLFLKNFFDRFEIRDGNAHFGMVQFNHDPDTVQQMTGSHTALVRSIDSLEVPNGATNIRGGLQAAMEQLNTYGRDKNDVPRLVIVLTDGANSNNRFPWNLASEQITAMKDDGVEIQVIAVGNNLAPAQLTEMSSINDYLLVDNFEQLEARVNGIVNNLCREVPDDPSGPTDDDDEPADNSVAEALGSYGLLIAGGAVGAAAIVAGGIYAVQKRKGGRVGGVPGAKKRGTSNSIVESVRSAVSGGGSSNYSRVSSNKSPRRSRPTSGASFMTAKSAGSRQSNKSSKSLRSVGSGASLMS